MLSLNSVGADNFNINKGLPISVNPSEEEKNLSTSRYFQLPQLIKDTASLVYKKGKELAPSFNSLGTNLDTATYKLIHLNSLCRRLYKSTRKIMEYMRKNPIQTMAMVLACLEVSKVTAQKLTSSATLNDGTVFVTWPYNSSSMYSSHSIQGRVLFPNGTGLTDEFIIASDPDYFFYYPNVSPLKDGNALVTWQFSYGILGATQIQGKIISPGGFPISPEFTIQEAYTNLHPSSTVLANGYGLVVWTTVVYGPQGDWGVYGQTISQYGIPLDNPFLISQNHTKTVAFPYVTYLTTGDAFVAWVQQSTKFNAQEVHGRIISSNGTPKTPEFTIDILDTAYSVAVAPLPYGNALAVWLGVEPLVDPMYAGKIYSSTGEVVRDSYYIFNNAMATKDGPSISSLSNKNVFVVGEDGTNALIGNIFSQKGESLFGPFPLTQNTIYLPATSSTTPLGNNTLVAWRGKPSDIYVRVFSAEGQALTKEIKINQM